MTCVTVPVLFHSVKEPNKHRDICVRFGSVRVFAHFLLLGSVLGWVLVRFVLAGFGFLPTSSFFTNASQWLSEWVRRWLQLRFGFESTAVRLLFDCTSTAPGPFDDLRCDRKASGERAAALWPTYINRLAWLRVAGYVTVTLRIKIRTAVESKSNRSCNHRINA